MALNQNREPDGEVGVGSVTARGGTGHGRKRHGTPAGAPRTLSPGLPIGGQLRFPPEK